jgi:hypothetical protein
LPELALVARNQQVGTNLRKPLSPSLVTICPTFGGVFRDLRYIFVTEPRRAALRLLRKLFRISPLQKPRASRSLCSDRKRIFGDIPKISERINLEPFARGDENVQDGRRPSAVVTPEELPVLPTHHKSALTAFGA